jgi:hypothetical protein
MKSEYSIGTQYTSGGKRKDICTVIDIHKTYDFKGDLVKTRYVSTHEFMGQLVTEHDIPVVSIQRGEL